MKLATKAVAFLMPLLAGSAAHAAANLCPYLPYFPSEFMRFEQAAAGIDTLGCRPQPVASVHLKKWECGEGGDQIWISLHRLVEDAVDLIIIAGPGASSLDSLRTCRRTESSESAQSPGFSLTPRRRPPRYSDEPISGSASSTAQTPRRPVFDPASIMLQDRLTVGAGLYQRPVYLLGFAGTNFVVAGRPDSGSNFYVSGPVRIVENRLLHISRPDLAHTGVEIAGRNLYESPAQSIIEALQSRGATITSGPSGSGLPKTVLSPPVGLEGVRSVEVLALERHTYSVTYVMNSAADFTTYTSLLTGRYGQPNVGPGTTRSNRTCRYRIWESGVVIIAGETCPNQPSIIRFVNRVVSDQLDQAGAPRPQQPRQRAIDPDNL